MKKQALILIGIALAATFSIAAEVHTLAQAKEDVARHRAIAAAHEAAAKCLESGKKEEVCYVDLQNACKGLAIGKFCGMKHVH